MKHHDGKVSRKRQCKGSCTATTESRGGRAGETDEYCPPAADGAAHARSKGGQRADRSEVSVQPSHGRPRMLYRRRGREPVDTDARSQCSYYSTVGMLSLTCRLADAGKVRGRGSRQKVAPAPGPEGAPEDHGRLDVSRTSCGGGGTGGGSRHVDPQDRGSSPRADASWDGGRWAGRLGGCDPGLCVCVCVCACV